MDNIETSIEQIELAIKGDGIKDNPILNIFDKHSDNLNSFFKEYSSVPITDRPKYASENMGFLEDDILNINQTELDPLLYLTMWGRLFKEMGKHIDLEEGYIGNTTTQSPGYVLARYLVHEYVFQGLSQERRKNVLEKIGSFPHDGAFKSIQEIGEYQMRLKDLDILQGKIHSFVSKFDNKSYQRGFINNVAENIIGKIHSLNTTFEFIEYQMKK